MWVVFILLVLCLGYLKLTSTPFGKAMLRRSQGWEAYAHLAKNGIELLVYGFLLTVMLAAALCAIAALAYILANFMGFEKNPYELVYDFFTYNLFRGISLFEALVVMFSYLYYVGKYKNGKEEQGWKESFKNQDAILHVILEAAETQTPLRISLKSRKVYIGLVESEQFERVDLDNVVIIPYLSGHRDKDTLQIVLDHNYFSVYKKNNILEAANFKRLSKFRVVIRLDEVESLSLFDVSYYSDFHGSSPETDENNKV